MRYTGWIFGFLLLLMVVLGAFTYHIDPYRAFHFKDVSTRSALLYYLRLIKPHHLRQATGDVLVLGSSRASKLRPQLATAGSGGYNAALPGMTSYEMLAHLRHANTLQATRRLIIGLDFSAYLDNTPLVRFGFTEARLAGGGAPLHSRLKLALRDRQQLLFSGSAIADALHIALGTQRRQMNFYRDGTWEMNATALTPSRKRKFLKIGQEYYERAAGASQAHNLEHLRGLVRYAMQENIAAIFFVSPVHALTLAAYEQAGQLEHYLRWQRDVLALLQEEADKAGGSAFPLFGFQTDDRASMESVLTPPPSPLYEDAIHYSFAYGDVILGDLQRAHPQHATLLTPASLSPYWAHALQSLDTFKKDNAKFLTDFENSLQPAR